MLDGAPRSAFVPTFHPTFRRRGDLGRETSFAVNGIAVNRESRARNARL